jgi:hypothetical protein
MGPVVAGIVITAVVEIVVVACELFGGVEAADADAEDLVTFAADIVSTTVCSLRKIMECENE